MKHIQSFILISIILITASCGNKTEKLSSNKFLGNIPSLAYQKAQQDSISEAKAKSSNTRMKDIEKYLKKQEAVEDKFEAALEKEGKQVKGKDIPYSVADGTGYEVLSMKISEVSKGKRYSGSSGRIEVSFIFAIKITDVNKLDLSFPIQRYSQGQIHVPVEFLDNQGQVIYTKSYQYVYLDTKDRTSIRNGAEYTEITSFSFYGKNAKDLVNFAKVRFPGTNKSKS
ncbi:MAG: hypothetical protein QM654_04555 [Dysgonamonadaceae bacterium]